VKFVLDPEQRLFAETLGKLLAEAGTPSVIRAWAAGDHAPGRALWSAIADAGVFALAVPESYGGLGFLPVELVTAVHELGRHAVPGPVVETMAAAAALAETGDSDWLPRIAAGSALVSYTRLGHPALDADVADLVLVAGADGLHTGVPGVRLRSLDPARRLFEVTPDALLTGTPSEAGFDLGVLACAAQLVGLGRGLLAVTVEYAKTRHQFGRPIGEFQAIKHQLADALTALEFSTPLLYGAALSHGTQEFARDVSAAKAAAAQAAYATARTALQVHGAIGYTDEYDPSLLIRKVRALYTAWGTPKDHRIRLLSLL
jgi:alkylation response protein AidB-like acyl-CoA dehydrogenase